MKALTSKELLKLLKVARERSVRDWAMMLLAYRHALRAGEVTGLRIRDVDMRARMLTVQRLKGSLLTVQPLESLAGQPLLNEIKALNQWLDERQDDSDWLFVSQKGGRMSTNGFWRLFKVIAEAAGIEGRSAHSLKHTRASLLIAGHASLSDVRQACGHKSLASTLRYISSTDEQAAAAARKAEANVF